MTMLKNLAGAALLACAATAANATIPLPYSTFLYTPLSIVSGIDATQPFSITDDVMLVLYPLEQFCGPDLGACLYADRWLLSFAASVPVEFALSFDGVTVHSGPRNALQLWEVPIGINYTGPISLTVTGGAAEGGLVNLFGRVSPIPEPSTYALGLLGLGSIAWRARRRYAATVIPKLS